ncbi:Mammalian cell entry related domain protein [Mycobacterium sp. E2479]|uniref:Mammalian cell entry related domain protein n=1 Tax=Mycobacterium sp. E2479 TaxID=1834134 RepID=UPI000800A0D6|nr:Mammalian cell entry related domain protein [Mycobacterium sp. E2479]OBH50484.1 Mammalian cell entry related domain protein [Mycobacterium sp. E2479]
MLLQTSAESETRALTIIGAAVAVVAAVGLTLVILKPFQGQPKDQLSISIDTPYIAQGIIEGTPLVMHGVELGKVTEISSIAGGRIRLGVNLHRSPTAGLTDAMQIDFRPINYFGVSGINIVPGAGGQALRNGLLIHAVPRGNYTLQTMLTRFGELSNKVITPQLVSVIDRITRYTDALNPLIETVFIATNTLAEVQTVPTERLLANATGISVTTPGLLNAITDSGDVVTHGDNNWMHEGMGDLSDKQWYKEYGVPHWNAIVDGIFGSVGKVESSHVGDLLPLINGFQGILDTTAPLLRPEGVGDTLVELRHRFEKLYGGTPEQRALRVRIVLDKLPGIAAPVDAMGGA